MFLVYQLEAGDKGTEHLQGYVKFGNAVRLSTLRKALPRAHYEPRRGTREQAREYCRKPDRLDGPWEFGEWVEPAGQGSRSDLHAAIDTLGKRRRIRDVAADHAATFVRYGRGLRELLAYTGDVGHRAVKVYIIYGRSGAGKTRYVHDMWGDEVYSLFSEEPLWFDGYDGQDVLLIDDYDNKIPRNTLLKMLDRYPYRAPIKGGSAQAAWTKVYFTANVNFFQYWDEALMRRVTTVEYVD